MTASIRSTILSAVAGVFAAGVGGVPADQVFRGRARPVGVFPALCWQATDDDGADNSSTGLDRYILTLEVEGFVEGATDAAADEAAEALDAAVAHALLANVNLGGADDIRAGSASFQPDRLEAKGCNATFSRSFEIEFFTRSGDPFAAA